MGGVRGRVAPAAVFAWCAVSSLGLGGCGRPPAAASGGRGRAVLGEVTRAYVTHLRSNAYRPPANEAAFRALLAQAGAAALRRAGVRSVDELLISPRDSQPFVIRYGAEAKDMLDRGVVAYERSGVEGHRLVGYALGYVSDLDQQGFEQLVPDHTN